MPDDAKKPAALKKREALRQAYAAVFDSPDGRTVLADIVREGGLLAVGYVAGAPDTAVFADGRRSLALHVLEQLRWGEHDLAALARARAATPTAPREAEDDDEHDPFQTGQEAGRAMG